GTSLTSAKQLRLIILTLAVVLLLWGASERLSRGSDTVTGGFSLSAPAPADVDTISLIKGKDSIVLARQSATAWTVNGRRAALDGVNELLHALHDSAPPELVAQDSSSFGRLNVDGATGRRLRVHRPGQPVREGVIGGRGSEYGSARGMSVALVFDSIPGAFWVRRTGGAAPGGETGVVYRMNAWDVDGLTPASRSLKPTAPAKP